MPFPAYTPTPTRLVTLNEADDQEDLSAATTNVSLEQLADGVAWLDGNTVKTGGGTFTGLVTFGDGATIGAGQPFTVDPEQIFLSPPIADDWTTVAASMIRSADGVASSRAMAVPKSPGVAYQQLALADGATIDGIRIYITANAAPAPAAKALLSFIRRAKSTGVDAAPIAANTDPSSATGYHTFELLFSDHTIDNATYWYFIVLEGETDPDGDYVTWHGSDARVSLSAITPLCHG